jgi:hypothetical protein
LLGYTYSWLYILIAHHPFNPKPFTVNYRRHTIFFFIYLGFPPLILLMADVDAANYGDIATVEKCGRGRPRGSKNKTQSSLTTAALSSPRPSAILVAHLGVKTRNLLRQRRISLIVCFLSSLSLVTNAANSSVFL